MELDGNVTRTLEQLIQLVEESAKRFYNAAEHIRNRGLKLVLKTYVQQRVRFANELRAFINQTGQEATTSAPVGQALSRGWTDLKATMTVQRQGRQDLVLAELASSEAEVLSQYADALKNVNLPNIRPALERQHLEIRTIQRRLALLAEKDDHRILVRLFNQAGRAEQVTQQFARAGFVQDDIYVTPIEDLNIYGVDQPQKRRSMRDAVMTTVLLGGLFGAILGLLLALAQRFYFPEMGGFFASSANAVMLELMIYGTLIGAFFALIFGLFIGRDAAEDDSYLEIESLRNGDTLVAVFTDQAHSAEAERIIGLKHQFEVEPAAA